MSIDELIMMGDENIDYSSLSEETLRALVWAEDLFIANSALVELAMRKSSIAAPLAEEILSKSWGDSHLQSSALDILFGLDQEKALDYMMKNVQSCDPYLLSTMMQLMIENEPFFESASPLAQTITERLKGLSEDAKVPDADTKLKFLKRFSQKE